MSGAALDELRKLSKNHSSAIELGKAAEHLVCADLILRGYRAFLSDQGLPYDVLVELGGKLLRIQCKAACFPRNVSMAGRNQRIAYTFHLRRRGKKGSMRLSNLDCDVAALVALDVRSVAYMWIRDCGQTVQLCPSGTEKSRDRWGNNHYAALRNIDEYPIENLVRSADDL